MNLFTWKQTDTIKISKIFLYLILSLFPSLIYSEPKIFFNNNNEVNNLEKYLEILEDKGGNLDYNEVSSQQASSKFVLNERDVLNFGLTKSIIWIRFQIDKNNFELNKKWLLEISNPALDNIEIYFPILGEKVEKKIGGDQFPFETRDLEHKNFVYFIPDNIDFTRPIYIRFSMQSEFFFSVKLWTLKSFTEFIYLDQFLNGIYYGTLIIMILYNLFIYFSIKDISYLYYILSTITLALTLLSLDGMAYQYFWRDIPYWAHRSAGIFAFMTLIGWIYFCKTFLITKLYTPILNKFLTFLALSCLVNLSILVFYYDTFMDIVSSLLTIICLVSLFFTGIRSRLKGYKPAVYYIFAWMLLIFSVALYPLGGLLQIPIPHIIEVFGMKIGSAFEILLFSLALANKINTLKREKEKALSSQLAESQLLASMSDTFKRFVPHDFIAYLGKLSITEIKLGDSAEREMSVLFSDIRSFTTLSENMSPKDTFQFVNSFFNVMGPVIRKHFGFIDKYIGDAIMAIFDKSADNAVKAAIEMLEQLQIYNEKRMKIWKNEIKIGIGINTGRLMLGTVGEEGRMESTVISDAVNLSSRLEGMTKMYGVSLLISESTYHKLENHSDYAMRIIDRVNVKGKKEPVSVWEVFNGDPIELKNAKLSILAKFEKAIFYYHNQNFKDALQLFNECLITIPSDKPTKIYIERCELLISGKLLWDDGITQLNSK